MIKLFKKWWKYLGAKLNSDFDKNAELAKQRAFAVRDALKAAGVAEDKIELKKPEQLTGSGDAAQARRVEVALQSLALGGLARDRPGHFGSSVDPCPLLLPQCLPIGRIGHAPVG